MTACRPLRGGGLVALLTHPGYANQTSRNSRAGGRGSTLRRPRRRARAGAGCGDGPGRAPVSTGVSRSAKTRSAETVAACMTENFAEASRIGR